MIKRVFREEARERDVHPPWHGSIDGAIDEKYERTKCKATMLSQDECLLKTPPKRQLDLPQAFIKQFVAPHNSSSDGPEVQPLLVQLLLDGKPIAQPHRVPVKWSRNRVNERSGQISYKHKLLLSEADIALLPEGAYVHTVKGTGLDSIALNCCTPQPGSRPQPQQPRQLPTSSAAQPQASAASQHTTSSFGLLAGKRRVLQAALKVTSAAAKRQRSHPHPHPQPGLAGQRLGLAGAQRASSGEPRLPVPGGVLAGQRPQQQALRRQPQQQQVLLWPHQGQQAASRSLTALLLQGRRPLPRSTP